VRGVHPRQVLLGRRRRLQRRVPAVRARDVFGGWRTARPDRMPPVWPWAVLAWRSKHVLQLRPRHRLLGRGGRGLRSVRSGHLLVGRRGDLRAVRSRDLLCCGLRHRVLLLPRGGLFRGRRGGRLRLVPTVRGRFAPFARPMIPSSSAGPRDPAPAARETNPSGGWDVHSQSTSAYPHCMWRPFVPLPLQTRKDLLLLNDSGYVKPVEPVVQRLQSVEVLCGTGSYWPIPTVTMATVWGRRC
jgi:hypothetical protein